MIDSILEHPATLKKVRAVGYFVDQKIHFKSYLSIISGQPNLPELDAIDGASYSPCPLKKGEIVLFDLFLNDEGNPLVTGKLVTHNDFDFGEDLAPKNLKRLASAMHDAISDDYPLKDYLFPCDVTVEQRDGGVFFHPIEGSQRY